MGPAERCVRGAAVLGVVALLFWAGQACFRRLGPASPREGTGRGAREAEPSEREAARREATRRETGTVPEVVGRLVARAEGEALGGARGILRQAAAGRGAVSYRAGDGTYVIQEVRAAGPGACEVRTRRDRPSGETKIPGDLPELGEQVMAIDVGGGRPSVLAAFRIASGQGGDFLNASFREQGWTGRRAAGASPAGEAEVFLYTKGRRQCLASLAGVGGAEGLEVLVLCDR